MNTNSSSRDRFQLGEEIVEPNGDKQSYAYSFDRSVGGIRNQEKYNRLPSEDAWIFRNKENSFDETVLSGSNGRPSRISSLPSSQRFQSNMYDDMNPINLPSFPSNSNSYLPNSPYETNHSRAGSVTYQFDPNPPFLSSTSFDEEDPVTNDSIPFYPISQEHSMNTRPYSLPVSVSHSEPLFSRDMPSDIPAIFHQSKGRRGGIRIGNDSMQDLAKLIASYQSYPSPTPYDHNPLSIPPTITPPSLPIRSDDEDGHTAKSSYYHSLSPIQRHYSSESAGKVEVLSSHGNQLPGPEESVEEDSCLSNCEALLHHLLVISKCFDFKHVSPAMICTTNELNPFAQPNAKLCYDFLNFGHCKRESRTGFCKYRHLAPDHIDAVMDRIFSGKMPVSLIQFVNNEYLVYDMPCYNTKYPGELNANASVNADLCLEYNLTGKCSMEAKNGSCPLRHLASCHPERIALLYQHGRLSEEESSVWHLTPCSANEVNPFSTSKERLCFDFMNHSYCKRNREGKICRFRHLLQGHEDAMKDRKKMINRSMKNSLA